MLLAAMPEPVPILGPPGIGKSTITLVALNDAHVAARYGQRRVFVRCDAIRTREALAAEVATALGLPLGPQIEPALFAELASAPTALAIDNAETPWEADTLRVEEFLAVLAALPGLALIASLRGASRPVGVPWRQPLQPPSLPLPDARKVFLAIAGDHFAADPHLDQVLLALDGVPLAITLMAGAAEGEPDLAGTWRRWQDERTNMLQRLNATHRLLNIEVSYEISIQGPRMTAAARRLLSLLSFLPGGIAHGDLDAVFPGQGARAATILRQVGLAFDQDRRLRLFAPLREYVQHAYPPPPDDQPPALSHYLGLARSLGEKAGGEGGAEAIVRLTPEAANIEVAILRGLDKPSAATAIRAALSFGGFVRFTGLGTTTALERAAKVAQTQGAVDLTAQCFLRLGNIALDRSDHDAAHTHYEAARPLYQRVGSLLGEANCIQGLGDIALRRSDHDAARTHYETALAMYERIPEPYSIGWAHRRLARIAVDDGRRRHVDAAKEVWQSIRRADLVAELIEEFGGE
jgi:tetratricopeptide (TPR) repeat protein